MRKDAKIGFAIGGVLLAVLTVYVIVVPPRHHAISPNAVTLSTPTDTPSADTTMTPPASSTTPDNSAPAPALAHNGGDGVNWERLLNGGSSPADEAPALMTVTPAGNGVTVPAPQPAAGANTTPPITLASSTPATPTTKPSDPVAVIVDPPVTHPVAVVVPLPSTKTREYTIKSGQTLSSIAGEVYGNSRFYVAILRANPHLDPTHLKVGVKIILPDASEVNPAAAPAAAASATKVTGRSYTVKPGDTLYAISKDLFGTPRQADAIYELNKTTIGPNEARLKQGMVLKLPDVATSPTAAAR